jgi:hypothetical protein
MQAIETDRLAMFSIEFDKQVLDSNDLKVIVL